MAFLMDFMYSSSLGRGVLFVDIYGLVVRGDRSWGDFSQLTLTVVNCLVD